MYNKLTIIKPIIIRLRTYHFFTAAKSNLIEFGDCFINKSKHLSFSLSNHSESQIMRFVWPEHNNFKISPQIGNL